MSGTGSGFSGCGVCAGAAVCSGGVFDRETGVATVCWMLGAIACTGGCADFLVSLLSHATSNSKPAASIIIFKRFKQHSISAQACPQSYISVGPFLLDAFLLDASSLLDGSGRHRAAFGSPDHRNKAQMHSPMNAPKRPAKPVELKVTLGKAPAELPFDFGNSGGFGDLQPL